MPLLRKQPFAKTLPPEGLGPEDEVFYCETTREIFTNYEDFFERTILCNSLVWSCSVTGKSNLTYEEAVESENKAKKRIGNMSKSLKRGLLYCVSKTKRGRFAEITDDVYDYTKSRYFVGEIVEAVIGNQWCESKVLRVIPPTEEEIAADTSEIVEVEVDGSPKKGVEKNVKAPPPDHLFKYEVEETEPDDEDMVELHTVEADDVKREKGVLTRDKLGLYLKNVVELDGAVFKLKSKAVKLYSMESLQFSDIFAGPEPEFEESLRKINMSNMNKNKKGQFTLDGWATSTNAKQGKQGPTVPKEAKEKKEAPIQPVKKKQTPEEIEEEMRKMREAQEKFREAQAKFREEQRVKAEELKKKRIEEKALEKERKAEEKRMVKELMNEWNARRDDLDCEDLKELPKPTPVRCRIPNQLFGDFLALLEFLHSFADILEVKDSYPGAGVTFEELEKALTETESPDGALYDIVSFMLVTLFDLQLEEEEESRADTDKTAGDELDKNILGKDEEVAEAIKSATEVANRTKMNLGLTLREVHLDQWSITEVLRLHLESSGAFRGNNLQNWRYQYRGGFRLQDDPGFQFCLEEPQILASLSQKSLFELSINEKLKVMTCMMNQMLSFAGVRDEIDTRWENVLEKKGELKEMTMEENRRIRELENEEKQKAKEIRQKLIDDRLKEAENKKSAKEDKLKTDENKENAVDEKKPEAPAPTRTSRQQEALLAQTARQQEAALAEKEKEVQDKKFELEDKRAHFFEKERKLQEKLVEYQNKYNVTCLGRDRAFRRFWAFDSLPGVFVEHDDDLVGECREEPTPWQPDSGPLDEETATVRAREIIAARSGVTVGSPSSDKENDSKVNGGPLGVNKEQAAKTYSKKAPVLKQKVLSANNGSLGVEEGKMEEVKPEEDEVKMEEDVTESKEVIPTLPWGRCLASGPDCPVHSAILPRTHWAFFSSVDQIDQLVDNLNPRGVREGELRERLVAERHRIERKADKCNPELLVRDEEHDKNVEEEYLEEVSKRREKASKYSGIAALPLGTSMGDIVELSLRDQILELEEKIFLGSLGTLKVVDREAWQYAITTRSYELGAEQLTWGEGEKVDMDGLLGDGTRPGSPDSPRSGGAKDEVARSVGVRQLSAAILQVGQMITEEEKYLKEPLGEDEKERKKRLKREEDLRKKKEKEKEEAEEEEEEEDEAEVEEKIVMTSFKKWERSLMACTNYGQLFMHLTTLDNSIVWSKSIMNTKCRVCRRKTDSDKMLICDGCDKGYHLFCLKPKLKNIPSGDWFCPECKPKERTRSPKKKVRRVFSNTEDDTEEDLVEEEEEVVPKKKQKSRKKLLESEDEEEEEVVSKKNPKNKKADAGSKKGSLANLFGKRKAAGRGEDKRRQEVEDLEEEEEEEDNSRRSKRKGKSDIHEENKENSRGKRRRDDDSDEEDFDPMVLGDLLKVLMHHDDGWPFDRPITKQDAPDYHLCVRQPMDLQTIRSRLDGMSHYVDNQAVIDDIKLIFSNCYQYNEEDTEEYQCAVTLEKFFVKELKKIGLVDEGAVVEKSRPSKRKKS